MVFPPRSRSASVPEDSPQGWIDDEEGSVVTMMFDIDLNAAMWRTGAPVRLGTPVSWVPGGVAARAGRGRSGVLAGMIAG